MKLKADKVLPKGNKLGNGSMTVNYEANGEASDWMLGDRGIIAMSPELGIADKCSNQFFIKTSSCIKKVIMTNLIWVQDVLSMFDHNYSQPSISKRLRLVLNADLPVEHVLAEYGHQPLHAT